MKKCATIIIGLLICVSLLCSCENTDGDKNALGTQSLVTSANTNNSALVTSQSSAAASKVNSTAASDSGKTSSTQSAAGSSNTASATSSKQSASKTSSTVSLPVDEYELPFIPN